jgi:hypothetical protein
MPRHGRALVQRASGVVTAGDLNAGKLSQRGDMPLLRWIRRACTRFGCTGTSVHPKPPCLDAPDFVRNRSLSVPAEYPFRQRSSPRRFTRSSSAACRRAWACRRRASCAAVVLCECATHPRLNAVVAMPSILVGFRRQVLRAAGAGRCGNAGERGLAVISA